MILPLPKGSLKNRNSYDVSEPSNPRPDERKDVLVIISIDRNSALDFLCRVQFVVYGCLLVRGEPSVIFILHFRVFTDKFA